MNGPTEDKTADLWLRIDQLHLNYLKSENNTKKLDIRKKLEGYVRQYLYLVPQDRKFCSNLASEIIWQSVRWIPNFSALKAASAFEAIEKYAANLINQPWRKEFKTIKQYGGFYKHQVENCLSGAEKLFQQMGYVSSGQETLELNGPVDQDQATVVARDCILAYVECQIVVSIVQRVSAHFTCTWEEVLDFRRDHIGNTEQAVRALIYLKNQNRHQIQTYPNQQTLPSAGRNEMPVMNPMHNMQPVPSYQFPQNQSVHGISNAIGNAEAYNSPQTSGHLLQNNQYHDANINVQTASSVTKNGQHYWTPETYMQQNASELDRVKALRIHQDQRYIAAAPSHPNASNIKGGSYTNGHNVVPTGNLVEFQSPPMVPPKRLAPQNQLHISNFNRESSSSSTSTLPGQGGPIPVTVKQLEDENRRKSVLEAAATAVTQGGKNELESWDYVYRQLENSGYSKDQAERPDVLEHLIKQLQLQKEQQQYSQALQSDPRLLTSRKHRNEHTPIFDEIERQGTNTRNRDARKFIPSDATNPLLNLAHKVEKNDTAVSEKHPTTSSKYSDGTKYNHDKITDREHDLTSSRPKSNLSSHEHRRNVDRYNKPLVPPNSALTPPQLPPKGRHRKSNEPSPSSKEQLYSDEEIDTKWECQFCTFLNEEAIDVCEMCAKSRLVSDSSRTTLNSTKNGESNRSQSALSHNSSRQTTTQGSSNAYYSEEESSPATNLLRHGTSYDNFRQDNIPQTDKTATSRTQRNDYEKPHMHDGTKERNDPVEGIECNRCTLVNDKSLKICEACGASLGLAPIDNKPSRNRHTSKSNNDLQG